MDEFTIFLLLGLADDGIAGVVFTRRQRWLPVIGCALLGLMLAWQLVHHAPVLCGLLAAVGAGLGFLRWSRTASTVSRWGARLRRKSGVASTVDILRRGVAIAVRRRTGIVRPSLAELPRWQRWRVPTVEVAVPLCRVGLLYVWSGVGERDLPVRRTAHRQDRLAGRTGARRPRRGAGHLHPHRPARAHRRAPGEPGGRWSCSTAAVRRPGGPGLPDLCEQSLRPEPPGYWRVADGLPVPRFSHQDGTALCRRADGPWPTRSRSGLCNDRQHDAQQGPGD